MFFGRILASLVLLSAWPVSAAVPGHFFDRVMFIVFENTDFEATLKQPFFKQLAAGGAFFQNFAAETHPSQGNYIALTSGSLNGVWTDFNYNLKVNHIGDLLEKKGVTWKVYAEDYPGNCFLGSQSPYVRKHNPFISYVNVQSDPARCAKIVNAAEFDRDFAQGTLPQYIFFVPNLKNDGHDTGVEYADAWYGRRFASYFANPRFLNGTLVVTTFDENSGTSGNRIYTSLIGSMVKPGQLVPNALNHYSLLRLVEDNWDLGSLGKEDAKAALMPFIWNSSVFWRRRF